MNTSYLLSVLDLYLQKEKNGKVIIEVESINTMIKVNFSYTFDNINKTYVKLTKEEFISCLKEFIAKIQGDMEVTKEEYDYNKQRTTSYTFEDLRRVSFINFRESDLKVINSSFSNLEEKIEEPINIHAYDDIVIEDFDDEEESYNKIFKDSKQSKFSFSFGFTSYTTLFLIAIWFLDILLIGLWIFKAMMK